MHREGLCPPVTPAKGANVAPLDSPHLHCRMQCRLSAQSARQHDAATVIAKSVHDARNKAITKRLRAYKRQPSDSWTPSAAGASTDSKLSGRRRFTRKDRSDLKPLSLTERLLYD